MPRVDIQRYEHPESVGYIGCVSTQSWIAFVANDRIQLFNRDDTGAVVGDDVTITL